MRKIYIQVVLSFLSILISHVLIAQNFPAGFAQQSLGNGLLVQTASAFAPDGRIFVAEQTGRIRIIKNGAPLSTPFATLSVDASGERGLLGIAVDPDFLINKFIYVYHTVPAAGGAQPYNRVIKLNATNDVVSGSPVVLLNLEPLTSNIHNAGAMHFGKDKKLYVAVGENARPSTAQDLTNYGGKLLRINTDGSAPADNPFFSNANDKAKRVWALGLRNPFTFAIDQETGKIFVNDVGQAAWEEINDATVGGRNFGWPSTEGTFNQSSFPNFTNPVYAYPHPPSGSTTYSDGVGCAIVGGAFISPSNTNYPAQYRGKYLYQDNCGNWINMLDLSSGTAVRSSFATSMINNSLCLTMGIDGLLYFSARHHQALYKIVYNNTSVPTITNHPVNVSVAVGERATFSVTALGTPPLSYQWQKNNVNIPGANSATYSIAQTALGDNGNYRVIVSNSTGSTATSNAATLTVINNTLPTAEILTPTAGTTYIAGNTINFSGQGTDPEDGAIPAQSMTWQINFHHDTHRHDEPPRNGIASGSFTVPQEGETSDNVWYRLILTVTDSNGSKGKDSVDVYPLKSTLAFSTVPAGLQITLDGQPLATPGSVVSVEGVRREIGVVSPQSLNNQLYEFDSWTHGGAQTQNIVTPSNNTTYTANFRITQNSFYRAFNINGPALSIDGNNWEASAGAANFTITGVGASSPSVIPLPATDANRTSMLRSYFWYQPNVTVNAVPQGNYQVWVYVFEDNNPATYSILLEGNTVQTNYNSGTAGTWRKLGPFPVTINDGNINIRSTSIDANFSGIEIWRTGQSTPTVTNPLVDQNAPVSTPFTYTFLANTFTPAQAGNTLTYAASLEGGGSLPAWLTFTPATRTFSGTPATGDIGTLNIRVTASETGGSSISDVFSLRVEGTTPTVTNPLVDQNAYVNTAFTYTFLANTFSPSQAGQTLTYTASLEGGGSLPAWLTFTPATRTFSGTPTEANIGSINVRVTAFQNTESVSDVFALNVSAAPLATFYRAINVNGPALSIDGNNWEASTGAPNVSITGVAGTSPSVAPVPSTDANRTTMLRSYRWYQPSVTVNAVPPGAYNVWVYVFEDNNPVTYPILVEGVVVQNNYNSGSAGTWNKLGPFPVTINDGNISVSSSNINANISGVEIWKAGPPTPTLTTPLVDQVATANTPFSYTFLATSFTPSQPGNTLTYSAALEGGGSLPAWLTFAPGTRTFSGTPTDANIGSINIRVTATEAAGSISDVFALNVSAQSLATFYRAINVNGPSISIDGNNWEASTGAPNVVTTGVGGSSPTVTPVPATDANRTTMLRSYRWYQPSVTINAVPAGTYDVWVHVFEDNNPATYPIVVEGNVVQANYNSGSAGTWQKLGPFRVTINDGNISVSSTSINANFSGVEVWTAGQGSSSMRLASGTTISDNEAISQTEDSSLGHDLAFFPNPFSNQATITYVAKESAPTKVSMYDVRGIKVWSSLDESLEKGHRAFIEVETSDFQDGVYVLEVVNGHDVRRLKLIRVR